jgi:four helix bundle protein
MGAKAFLLLTSIGMSKADDLQARTDAFSDLSLKFVEGLPDTSFVRRIAGQFQDCSTSVGANYRAARRAKSRADLVSKIATVSEEADESVFWLTRLRNANIRSANVELNPLLAEAEELARIFGASHRTAKRRQRKRSDDPMDR